MAEMTPMMRQYLEIKEQNKDAIAPFAMERYYGDGDFHTAYYGQITAAYIVE